MELLEVLRRGGARPSRRAFWPISRWTVQVTLETPFGRSQSVARIHSGWVELRVIRTQWADQGHKCSTTLRVCMRSSTELLLVLLVYICLLPVLSWQRNCESICVDFYSSRVSSLDMIFLPMGTFSPETFRRSPGDHTTNSARNHRKNTLPETSTRCFSNACRRTGFSVGDRRLWSVMSEGYLLERSVGRACEWSWFGIRLWLLLFFCLFFRPSVRFVTLMTLWLCLFHFHHGSVVLHLSCASKD